MELSNLSITKPKYGVGKGKSIGYGNFFRKYESAYISYGGNLPHWQQQGVLQYITFRLGDSLPQHKLAELKELKNEWLEKHPQPWSDDDLLEYEEIIDKVDVWLDSGYGECLLKYIEIQQIIENSIKYYDGKRYDLYDYIIMPNHVHCILIPYPNTDLKQVMHGIKSFTAHKINKLLKRKGKVWIRESFDRLIRGIDDYNNKAEYIKHNGDFLL